MSFIAFIARLRAGRVPYFSILAGSFVAGLLAASAYGQQPEDGNRSSELSRVPLLLRTPLEAAGFKRLSTAEEVSAYLARLDREFARARVETIGTSVQGRPLKALVLSKHADAEVSSRNRVTVEIIGSQHGTESAGTESLLVIARDLLAGSLRGVLDDIDVVLIPDPNPDGRENLKRANANGVNLNVDFVALTQPESRALVESLQRYRPEVILDVHESAILKRKSLATEGFLTDFVVQCEFANNPNVPQAMQTFSRRSVLDPWMAAVNAAGLECHRYIGEIRSSKQPVTNGGLTLQNLRNRAAIEGSMSFLIETRLEPREGEYPTYRNIGERIRRQRTTITQFLKTVHAQRKGTLAALAAARPQAESVPLVLAPRYVPRVGQAKVPINLRRIADDKLMTIQFVDQREISNDTPLPLPAAYIVRENQAELASLFDRHGIEYRTLDEGRSEWAVEFAFDGAKARARAPVDQFAEGPLRLRATVGDLWVSVDQPRGRLAALILEPRSTSSLFRTPRYAQLVAPGRSLPVYRVPR